jgi:hypothetical protein
MQAYLCRPLDLLDPTQMSAAVGPDADRFVEGMQGGITIASARYCHGDHFTAADYETPATMPRSVAGAAFGKAFEQRLGDGVCCVPANTLVVDRATTIGLLQFGGLAISKIPPTRRSDCGWRRCSTPTCRRRPRGRQSLPFVSASVPRWKTTYSE